MNALWVWRNRNCSVSFWWELLYWMNNLCNCCLLVCRAWILPDRCAWRAVSVCSDCTNTSVVHPLLNLVSSQIVIPASFVFPIAGWVQAECLGRAGLDPLLYTQPLSGPEIALLCPHSWHFHFTDITLCLHWPKMPTYALATRQLSSSLAISACFALQKQLGAYDPDSEKDLFHLTSVIQAFERKEKESMWSSKKISLKTCQTWVWLARN